MEIKENKSKPVSSTITTQRVCTLAVSMLMLGAFVISSPTVFAQADYPSRAVTVVNPWTPGGPAELVARPILEGLSEQLKVPFVLDTKSGANGLIGTSFVARAQPDGYTLLLSHVGPITISPAVQKSMPIDTVKDLAPITQVVSAPLVLVVRPDLNVKSLQELLAMAKANPGKVSYGSVGPGSTTHLAGEILANRSGTKLLHVPYKGAAPVITDLLGGRIDMAFLNISAVMPHIKSGKMVPIGVTTLKPSALLPNLPPISDTYNGFEVNSWYGFMAPAGTSPASIDKLQKAIAAVIATPKMKNFLEAQGLTPEGTTPEQYAKQIQTDLARWNDIVKTTGMERQ
jgi:tripartite-type tricarboxylate transporter receptor subunit TctC